MCQAPPGGSGSSLSSGELGTPQGQSPSKAAGGTSNSNPSFFFLSLYGYRASKVIGAEQRAKKPGLLPTPLPWRMLQEGDSGQVRRCWHFHRDISLHVLRKNQ